MDSLPNSPPFNVVELSGPLIIDEILSLPLLGALTVQLYFYLQAFPKDRSFVKGLVCAICCVILFDEIVDLDSYFDTFGPGFADISSLLKIRLTWIVGPLAAGLLGLASQTFYAHRIYILSGNRVLSSLVLVISLTSTTACVTLSVWISQAESLLSLRSRRTAIVGEIYFGATATCDILIAVCMTYYLTKADTGFRRTHALISKLVWLIIGTGSLTGAYFFSAATYRVFMLVLGLMTLASLALYLALPDKLYYQTSAGVLPYLHANSVLVILNSRLQLSRGRVDEVSGGMTISNLQFAGPASNWTEPPSMITNGARARVLSTAVTTTELNEMKEMEGAASRHVVLGQMGLNSGSSEASGAEEVNYCTISTNPSLGVTRRRQSSPDKRFTERPSDQNSLYGLMTSVGSYIPSEIDGKPLFPESPKRKF